MALTRRAFLVGAAAVAAAGGALALQGDWDPRVLLPDGPTGPIEHGELDSRARSTTVRYAVAYPPGSSAGDDLPLALVLHGRGDDSADAFGSHGLHRFLGDAVRAGTPPFALVAMDGGDHSYWHRRRDGDDPQSMLLEELLPALRRRGLRTQKVGVTGWSMGGYGALLLGITAPDRVAAVSTDAAALWLRAGDTPEGAFDDREDFERHDVMARLRELRMPVRIGCGLGDPFIATNREAIRRLPKAEHQLVPGEHSVTCWNLLRPAEMRFLGRHLAQV